MLNTKLLSPSAHFKWMSVNCDGERPLSMQGQTRVVFYLKWMNEWIIKIKLKSGKTFRANIRDLSNHKKRDITVYVHMLPESNAGWSNDSANSFLAYSLRIKQTWGDITWSWHPCDSVQEVLELWPARATILILMRLKWAGCQWAN